jgi:hypothetical protein
MTTEVETVTVNDEHFERYKRFEETLCLPPSPDDEMEPDFNHRIAMFYFLSTENPTKQGYEDFRDEQEQQKNLISDYFTKHPDACCNQK